MTMPCDSREVRTHVYWLFYICIYTWVDMYTQRLKVTVTIGGAGAFNVKIRFQFPVETVQYQVKLTDGCLQTVSVSWSASSECTIIEA